MRVLVVTWNATAHLAALTPLSLALYLAGHEVLAAAPPAAAAEAVRRGLSAVAVGPDPVTPPPAGKLLPKWSSGWESDRSVLDERSQGFLKSLAAKQIAAAGAMLPELVEFAVDWGPDLVLHDASTLAGPVVAARLGVPAIGHSWGRVAPIRLELDENGHPSPAYAELVDRFEAVLPSQPGMELEPCPPLLRLGRDDRIRDIRPVAPPATLPARGRRPRVAVAGDGAEELREVVAAAGFDSTSVIAHGDVVLHNGSAGPLLDAVIAAKPQLVLSNRPEQQLTGDQVAATGSGLHFVRSELTTFDAVRDGLRALVEDGRFRDGAAMVAADAAATPTPAEVARTLSELALTSA